MSEPFSLQRLTQAAMNAVQQWQQRLAPPPTSVRVAMTPPLIVLDPGHGYYVNDITTSEIPLGKIVSHQGATRDLPGKRFVQESDITLAVAQKLEHSLNARGFRVLLTRDSAEDVMPTKYDTRLATGKGDKLLHLSIHVNSFVPANSQQGMIVYYSDKLPADSLSADFARTLGYGRARPHNSDLLEPSKLRDVPAAMAEIGNIRNNADFARMTSEHGQQAIADTLADRIVTFYHAVGLPGAAIENPLPTRPSAPIPAKILRQK